jgi:hypothetical protein
MLSTVRPLAVLVALILAGHAVSTARAAGQNERGQQLVLDELEDLGVRIAQVVR